MLKDIPNILSSMRLLSSPVLLYLAFIGKLEYFLTLFIFSMLTDILDGYLARKLDSCTPLGAKLDTLGDLSIYLILPLCFLWLYPDLFMQEVLYVGASMVLGIIPVLAGIAKFGVIPSFHTWGSKFAAGLMGIAMVLLFGLQEVWPFHIVVMFQCLITLEGLLIIWYLPELRTDVKSFWHITRQKN